MTSTFENDGPDDDWPRFADGERKGERKMVGEMTPDEAAHVMARAGQIAAQSQLARMAAREAQTKAKN